MTISSIGAPVTPPVTAQAAPTKAPAAASAPAATPAPAQGTTSTAAQPPKPLVGAAAAKAAVARYLRTGIDKDAAAGDPDHDAPASKRLAAISPTHAVASAVPTLNAVATSPAATAAAASSAYTAPTKK